MPPIYRSDDGPTGREGVDNAALLEAATRVGRHIAGGVSHDLNSALQGLGDALFAIGADAAGASLDPETTARLKEALHLADCAYTRITATARAVPSLIPAVGDESPVDLETELRDVVALTAHNWRYRLDVSVEVDHAMQSVVCSWWIVRLATLRMALICVQAHPARRHGDQPLPRLRLIGATTDGGNRVEVRVVCDHASGVVARAPWPAGPGSVDETLQLCANSLGGDVSAASSPPGTFAIAFGFPVRAAKAIDETIIQ